MLDGQILQSEEFVVSERDSNADNNVEALAVQHDIRRTPSGTAEGEGATVRHVEVLKVGPRTDVDRLPSGGDVDGVLDSGVGAGAAVGRDAGGAEAGRNDTGTGTLHEGRRRRG